MRAVRSIAAASVAVGLVMSSALVAAAQSPVPAAGVLVTEKTEPGVERIIRDDAGHDLDEKHPTYRYDMDNILITPDGTVWLSTTHSRSDNDANPQGPLVWALGKPGIYTLANGVPPLSPTTYLYLRPDGTRVLVTYEVVSSEDGASIPDLLPWGSDQGAVSVTLSDGEHSCQMPGANGVTCEDPAGEKTTYLKGTPINAIAVAPDGTLWAVGGHAGDNGGLYRITLE